MRERDDALIFRPNPGPQESFLSTSADIAFYGGAAGGGKTYAVILDALRWASDPRFGAIIFRRESVDLIGPGSVWEEASALYPLLGATMRQSQPREARFPSGAHVVFDHLQHENDKLSHQGMQYAVEYFEELTHFTETQFWYLTSRLRTKAKLRPYVRATCNPDPDSWVRRMVDWWIGPNGYVMPERSGVLRYFVRDGDELVWSDSREDLERRYRDPARVKSFTFILSRLKDNPKIDTSYRSNLLMLPTVERERLLGDEDLGGNWDIRPSAGIYFNRRMFRMRERPPEAFEVKRRIRAWDKAASVVTLEYPDPDWTRGVLLAELHDGSYVVEHLESLRGTPGEVEKAIRAMAELDPPGTEIAIFQDPGQAGVADVHRTVTVLRGKRVRSVRPTKDKVAYANTWQSRAEHGRVSLVRAAWNHDLLTELEGFPERGHDDIVDAMSLGFLLLDENVPVAKPLRVKGL